MFGFGNVAVEYFETVEWVEFFRDIDSPFFRAGPYQD